MGILDGVHSVRVQVAVFGRPRGRNVDCSANALADCSTQGSSPNGLPRRLRLGIRQ
jgi:hypothetical protein